LRPASLPQRARRQRVEAQGLALPQRPLAGRLKSKKTAKALGLEVAATLLARVRQHVNVLARPADEVIE
jgi:hypothetical protein